MTFNEVTDSVEVSNNIDTLCQGRNYGLYMSDMTTTASFITLSGPEGGPYTITANPTLDSHVGTWTFKLRTRLTAYSTNPSQPKWTNIPVVVQAPICNQNGLGWVATSPVTRIINVATGPTTVAISPYTVDPASKTATPEMRGCSGSFDETFTLSAVQKD